MKGDPLRSQNHDELKSSTVGPDLPYDFAKIEKFQKFSDHSKNFFCFTILKQERCEPFQDDRELLWVDLPERGLTRGRIDQRDGRPERGLARGRVDQRESWAER